MKIARGIAKGLEYLHSKSFYGSMRPNNVLLTHDYDPLVIKFIVKLFLISIEYLANIKFSHHLKSVCRGFTKKDILNSVYHIKSR